ncbi:hypothetical protein [Streptomyces sp. NPDC055036]
MSDPLKFNAPPFENFNQVVVSTDWETKYNWISVYFIERDSVWVDYINEGRSNDEFMNWWMEETGDQFRVEKQDRVQELGGVFEAAASKFPGLFVTSLDGDDQGSYGDEFWHCDSESRPALGVEILRWFCNNKNIDLPENVWGFMEE